MNKQRGQETQLRPKNCQRDPHRAPERNSGIRNPQSKVGVSRMRRKSVALWNFDVIKETMVL